MNRTSFQIQQQSSVIVQTPPDACRFGESFHIIFRWKKSIYKMIWRHSIVFLVLYFALSLFYNYGLTEKAYKKNFEALTEYCARYTRSFNWMIMLGFFTNTALHRMFTMQMTMPGTARPITAFIMSLKPNLPEGPDIVDQYARWITLVWILTFRSVCKPLRVQYPDLISLQNEGILLDQERRILDRQGHTPRPLIVFEWLLLLLKECLINDRFVNKSSHNKNVENLNTFRKSCSNIVKFSTQNIPYAVIQAAILVVYCFGMITAMARNLPKFDDKFVRQVIAYFPVIPYIQYFVFIAWLSCGRAAVNPFGDDDTDIDIRKLSQSHVVDSLRLRKLYTKTLDDVFKNLPQKKYQVTDNDTISTLPNPVVQPAKIQSILMETKFTRIITDV